MNKADLSDFYAETESSETLAGRARRRGVRVS